MLSFPVPPALLIAFEGRATVPAVELCRLLPIDAKLLRKHIEHCNIECAEMRAEDGRLQKIFTLDQVLDFLRLCTKREVPSASGP